MRSYDHRKIEKKWREKWAKAKLYQTANRKKGADNFYLLTEFPYPSGNLHVGHWYAFSVPDILARYSRMAGKNVLYPIGFDAFGLPAENAAIKNKLNPRKWTEKNIAYMKKQIRSMGTMFDWSREVQTIDPVYYKWTQWMFIQFFKKGLAYQKDTPVNWCPSCKTVLANEQVVDGRCERCKSEVMQKQMLQWNLKITDYADRLVDDLDQLNWPDPIKEAQRAWIGRSEGAEIDFPLVLDADSKKYTYVILHGWKGSPDTPRYRHWKAELEKQGHKVIIPALPNPDNPTEKEQVAAALAVAEYDENTVLFGHSLGAPVAMKVVEQLKKPIARLVLAGGFVDRNFKDKPRPFDKKFSWKFDGEKIRKNAEVIQILHDVNDYAISEVQLKRLEDTLGVNATRLTGEKPHFTGEKELPVLRWLRPTITVFTTRADTLFGGTFLVLAPEHPWVTLALKHKTVLTNNDEVAKYVVQAAKKTERERQESKEKTGVELKGVKAINPASGAEIPLYVADFAIATFGTGALFGDAHDERDVEFATKHGIALKETIRRPDGYPQNKIYTEKGTLYDSGEWSGMTSDEAIPLVAAKCGRLTKTYRLRDWVVSRQRYWGVPIPIVHCAKCGTQAVPDKDLPVKLPEVKDYLPDGRGKSPLAKAKKWVSVKCPKCKGPAKRETDTLDTFVDSSWYFLRYCDPKNKKKFADPKVMAQWMPINLYSGGAEHTTMHVLYSRFWHKALYDLGLVADQEPYTRRMNRSLILGPDGQKMSKSRGNVIDPDEVVERLGADTVRMYLAFIGPYNEVSSYPWNPDGVVGVRRFLERVWKVGYSGLRNPNIENLLHKTIKKVGDDIVAMKFNTAISALMIVLNAIEKQGIGKEQWKTFLRLLAPFAPHMAEELWHLADTSGRTGKKSVHLAGWPEYDASKLKEETATLAVQVNGKTRAEITVPTDAGNAVAENAAKEAVASRLEGKEIIRTIVVPNRLVNFVVKE